MGSELPADWEVKRLGDIVEIRNGTTPSTRNPSFWDGTIPWCTPTDITSCGAKYLNQTHRNITDFGLESCLTSMVPIGSLLLCSRATIGEVRITTSSVSTNQGIKSLICGPSILNEYLYYVLLTLKRQMIQGAVGSTFLELQQRQVSSLEIPIPQLKEQHAISTVLSNMDALLDSLDRLIAKKRNIKQAAMQQLLTGRTRLPGFKDEWEEKRLGELGQFLKGNGVRRDDAQSGHLACVRYGEIYTVHHDYIRVFHSWISSEIARTATRVKYSDLLFAGSGETREEIGKCVAIVDEVDAYAGGDIIILRPIGINPHFLGYALNMPYVARQKANLGQGDAVVHISKSALASVRVHIPTLEEQNEIASFLFDMDAEIEALEARRDKTQDLKQAMMQELLTGRTRLIEPETSDA